MLVPCTAIALYALPFIDYSQAIYAEVNFPLLSIGQVRLRFNGW